MATNKDIGNRMKAQRELLGLTLQEVANRVGVASSTIQRYETGNVDKLKLPVIEAIANALSVNPSWIIYKSFDKDPIGQKNIFSIPGLLPLPKMIKKPRLGVIACGQPIMAEQNFDGYDDVPENIHCDLTLKCQGDSMINARINDGDIIYIRLQPTVENGEIAAVRIDGETTLKRFYQTNDQITLIPANDKYAPMTYIGGQLEYVEVIGKAVGFTSIL